MWKLRIKKGITLLEAVIALSVFSIIMFCAFSVQNANIRQRALDKALKQYMECIEAASNTIIEKNSYSTLQGCESAAQWYVNEENLNFDTLTDSNIILLMSTSVPTDNTYMKVTVSGNDILTITFEIKFKVNGKVEVIRHEAYKGSYN